MRTAAARRLALALLGGILPALLPAPLPRAAAQDAPPAGAPAAPPAIAPAKPRKPLPEDPPKKVAKAIEEALQAFFAKDPAILAGKENIDARSERQKAFGELYKGVQEWNAKVPGDSCLRAVAWWKTALLNTYPTSQPKTKLLKEEVPDPLGKAPTPIILHIPPGYRGKSTDLYPVILTTLDKDADPKKVFEAAYGPLLATHIVVAVAEDKVGTDRFRLLRGLSWVLSTYRADHHRVALDGIGRGAALVDALGPEVAILFNGVVLRGPTTVSGVAANLGLFPCAAVLPSPAPAAVKEAVEGLKKAVSGLTVIEGLGTPAADAAIQSFLQSLPPRGIRDQSKPYTWFGASQGARQVWGYWFAANQAVDAGKDLPIRVRIDRDPALNLIDIDCTNLAAGMLLLNDEILDLDQPVVVRVNGVVVLTATVTRDLSLLFASDGFFANSTWPRDLFITAAVVFDVPEEARMPVAERKALEEAQWKAAEAAAAAMRRAAEEQKAKDNPAPPEGGPPPAGGGEPAPAEKTAPGGTPPGGGAGEGEAPGAGKAPLPPATVEGPMQQVTSAVDAAKVVEAPDSDYTRYPLSLVIKAPAPGAPAEEAAAFQAIEAVLAEPGLADGLSRTRRILLLPPAAAEGAGAGKPGEDPKASSPVAASVEAQKAPALLAFGAGGKPAGTFPAGPLEKEKFAAGAREFLQGVLPKAPAAPPADGTPAPAAPAGNGAGGTPPAPPPGEAPPK